MIQGIMPSTMKARNSIKGSGRRLLLISLAGLCATGFSAGVSAEYADVVLNRLSDKNDVRPVIFPHWFHRIRFRCKVCHNELGFEMRAGANEITMGKIIDGQYCGLCHNDEIAWGVDNCSLCHSGKHGLKTGIRGSNQTGGPGRW